MELSSSSGVVAGVLALELSATSGKRNEKREFYVKLMKKRQFFSLFYLPNCPFRWNLRLKVCEQVRFASGWLLPMMKHDWLQASLNLKNYVKLIFVKI